MARFIDIHPVDPQPRLVRQAIDIISGGGLMAYPTDSLYALGARLGDRNAKDRITAIRRLDDKHHFTLMCRDFSQVGQFVQLDNATFRAVKAATPGQYTFILPASAEVPRKLMHPKKRTVGIRIPQHRVIDALLAELGEPLLSSTLLLPDHEQPPTLGWQIKEDLDHVVDVVIDCGECGVEPTTVVDFSDGAPVIVRYGAGDPSPFE